MKRLILFLLATLPASSFAQVPLNSGGVNLSAYVPTQYGQYRGTCFAYATTYTALSMEYNIRKGITDNNQVNLNAFSSTFTASEVRKQKSFFKKLFTLWSCNIGGNITEAGDVLVKIGALKVNDFPLVCKTALSSYTTAAAQNRITGYISVLDFGNILTAGQKTAAIKAVLDQRHPVICAITQSTYLENAHVFYIDEPAALDNAMDLAHSNHALCVIGYNDHINGGSFLIKNNYTSFGINGMAWITYHDFMKYLCYAICLQTNFCPAKN